MLKRSRRTNFGGLLANLLDKKKNAFTLAETLIALGVIGIIAALTIPSLLTTISDKVTKNKIAVFERKLSKGTDLLNIEYGIGPYYNGANPSYEFAQALSKHLKIVTICDKNNLTNCFPYSYIQTEMGNKKVSDLKTGVSLQLDSANYVDTAGIVLGDGTPMIFSWNKNCPVSDPDTVEKGQTTACISGIYDLNGSKGPNKFGKDVMAFGSANLGWINFAGLKVGIPFVASGLYVSDYCTKENGQWVPNKEASDAGVNCCEYCRNTGIGKDRWAGAMIECKKAGGHLASLSDLAQIAAYITDSSSQIGDMESTNKPIDSSKLGPLSGLGNAFTLYSSDPYTEDDVYGRGGSYTYNRTFVIGPFPYSRICMNCGDKANTINKALCVKD